LKAVVYQEQYKVSVEEMTDPKIEAPNDAAYDKFDKRVDGYTKGLIKPGMAA
jgi:hypothetical protein